MSSGLTGLTGPDCGILSQKQKGSLFMVKVKAAFCILCVCYALFASQRSLSWDTRLWPLLGGTTRTRWFSNINHKGEKSLPTFFYCFVLILHPTFIISHCWTEMPNPSPPSGHPQADNMRPNEARSSNVHGVHNIRRSNQN